MRGEPPLPPRSRGDEVAPYPTSLCHRCAAPPRYVRTAASTFILCPLRDPKYPPQPVVACDVFVPRVTAAH